MELFIRELDRYVTMDELMKSIYKLKFGNSSGNDLISCEFIMHAPVHVKKVILNIFNTILKLENFPKCWVKGNNGHHIFKSGDSLNTNNYRGITLLSCIGKLFMRIVNEDFRHGQRK